MRAQDNILQQHIPVTDRVRILCLAPENMHTQVMTSKTGTDCPRIIAWACLYCRHEKIRCNTARPRCATCTSQNWDCVYHLEAPRKREESDSRPPRMLGARLLKILIRMQTYTSSSQWDTTRKICSAVIHQSLAWIREWVSSAKIKTYNSRDSLHSRDWTQHMFCGGSRSYMAIVLFLQMFLITGICWSSTWHIQFIHRTSWPSREARNRHLFN